MAIAINASMSKKVQLPGHDYASQQASITITGEVTELAKVADEAARLLKLAESAVDAQLHLTASTAALPTATTAATVTPNTARPSITPGPAAARSAPSSNRRAPAAVTDSQLRFIDKLIVQTCTSVEAILAHHQVGSLRDLSCKVAAGLIDELKSKGVAR